MALRQRDFCFELSCKVSIDQGEAGATVFACENEHFDVAIRKGETGYEGILKFNVGPAKHLQKVVSLSSDTATVIVRGENCSYSFYIADSKEEIYLGSADAKYVSTEVAGGFTGVMLGLYAVGNNTAKFTDFTVKYE
jgi:alpha-N-arabinofuranosidase